jgi:drug/metabolite transporter (DMT)-like permease
VVINLGCCGIRPEKLEIIGMAIVLVGCSCMLSDPNAQRIDGIDATLLVYTVTLLTAMFGAVYYILNAKSVTKVPICLLILML